MRQLVGRTRMPAEGIEPTRSCDHWILSPARLPVPPRRREEREASAEAWNLKRYPADPALAACCGADRKSPGGSQPGASHPASEAAGAMSPMFAVVSLPQWATTGG